MPRVLEPASIQEIKAKFDQDIQETVQARWDDERTLGAVLYQVQDMCSSQFGHVTILVYGPGWSCQSKEQVVKNYPRLGDVPSRFAYPVAFAEKGAKHE